MCIHNFILSVGAQTVTLAAWEAKVRGPQGQGLPGQLRGTLSKIETISRGKGRGEREGKKEGR